MNYTHTDIAARHYRSIWISDVHLGFPGCSADYLLDFLRSTKCEYLYLVGDIIDVWYMKKRMYWPQEHNNVIRTILGKAKHGTKVIYIPGNHDEIFREYVGMTFGNVQIKKEVIHTLVDGRRLMVSHGDEFDAVVQCSPALAVFGSKLYDWLLYANRHVNYILRKLGYGYWSLAAYLKHKVKNAVQYIGNFEHAVMYAAASKGVDGYICGHIHRAEISKVNTLLYCNTGDWVESCTALVEKDDGTLELLHWTEEQQMLKNSIQVLAAA
jgi:UDP-2,3-diacylglucosamine pyrophosphatase LpxH